ncbi:MAG TPA: tetratricopeptide repeat protein [Paraburkholderia sp.]|uniref:ATP-grasp domain-containing protein n=1 Tax=Paraburkholderia sp. TaxID=1926495 RepID=UPI002B48E958|nr:tetratricopeptide repeat protein [Paraburkholderia sp.]HKR41066.1 tetratricopeptide repeat protein [Paraburkholderia sp.]
MMLDFSPDERETVDRSLDASPLDVSLHRRMHTLLHVAGDVAGQAAHELALAAFGLLTNAPTSQLSLVLYNLATVYFLHGQRDQAKRWYRHALSVNPALAIAHQNLSVLLESEGRYEEAIGHRDQAYRIQRVFEEGATCAVRRRVLILGSGRGTGNVPIDGLIAHAHTHRIKYAIDYASPAEDSDLPPYDLVFNGIGDADVAHLLAVRISQLTRGCSKPVLNSPERVARTHRHRITELLSGINWVDVPACVRLEGLPDSREALQQQLGAAGIGFPLLMRPPATHGGDGIVLHDTVDTLWVALLADGGPCYLTEFRDFRSDDGFFRKYRMIYVDRVPYAYHLAISQNWIVHYYTAGMTEHPWKIDEERRFLSDPRAVLGARAMDALIDIGNRLDLDYGGIDFSLTPDGGVLVFEANATMLAHRVAPDGPLAHKNLVVERIAEAFEALLQANTER